MAVNTRLSLPVPNKVWASTMSLYGFTTRQNKIDFFGQLLVEIIRYAINPTNSNQQCHKLQYVFYEQNLYGTTQAVGYHIRWT
jgi:hypothetical protein